MKNKHIRAPEDKSFVDDSLDEPAEMLALATDEPNHSEHPIPPSLKLPLTYFCLGTLAVINHYGHLVSVFTGSDLLIACKSIWKATQN